MSCQGNVGKLAALYTEEKRRREIFRRRTTIDSNKLSLQLSNAWPLVGGTIQLLDGDPRGS